MEKDRQKIQKKKREGEKKVEGVLGYTHRHTRMHKRGAKKREKKDSAREESVNLFRSHYL